MTVLAWIPFLEPMPAAYDGWWLSALPLAWGVSMVYKAYRLPTLDRYWRSVGAMTAQILVALACFSLALAALVQWIVPLLPVG